MLNDFMRATGHGKAEEHPGDAEVLQFFQVTDPGISEHLCTAGDHCLCHLRDTAEYLGNGCDCYAVGFAGVGKETSVFLDFFQVNDEFGVEMICLHTDYTPRLWSIRWSADSG